MRHQPILLTLLFVTLVSAIHTEDASSCPTGCSCNVTINHAKCTTLSGLIRFDQTSSLQSLDLSNIGLRKITSHLDKFPSLEKIDLSGNRLSEVNKLPKGITDLNLSNNRITSAKLSKIPKSVVNLNLSENHITYVPHSIMTLKDLRHLELSGNPINCTCDTLAVRNWLKTQHVWMDRHVTCNTPLKFKGRPWLQMKQAEVCEVTVATKKGSKFESKYNWDEIEKNDNELMQKDAEYVEGSGDDDAEDDEIIKSTEYDYADEDENPNEPIKEPEKKEEHVDPVAEEVKEEELIPVQVHASSTEATVVASPTTLDYDDEDYEAGSGEGSGDHHDKIPIAQAAPAPTTEESIVSSVSSTLSTSSNDDDYDAEDEGSGESSPSQASIPFIVPVEPSSTTESDITFEPDTTEEEHVESSTLPELGIFDPSLATTSTEAPVQVVEPRSGLDSAPVVESATEDILDHSTVGLNDGEKANVVTAKTDDSKNTFILLGILGILLVCLIVYVAIKDKTSRRNRRSKGDVENGGGKEMKEMSKDLLGKEKGNGHHPGNNHYASPEKSPLMNHDEKPNGHSYPAVSPNKIGSDDVDHPVNSSPMSTFKPIKETPDTVEQEPVTSTEPNNNQLPEVHQETPASPKRYSPVYTPRTPKLGNQHLTDPKYSPVYSPETGRVKVKATETPRPKTPVLVTRTKSSAGDYITTKEELH